MMDDDDAQQLANIVVVTDNDESHANPAPHNYIVDGAEPPNSELPPPNTWGLDEVRYNRDYNAPFPEIGNHHSLPVFAPDLQARVHAREDAMTLAQGESVQFIRQMHDGCFAGNMPLHIRMYHVANPDGFCSPQQLAGDPQCTQRLIEKMRNMDVTMINGMFQAKILLVQMATDHIIGDEDLDSERKTELLNAARAITTILIKLNDMMLTTLDAEKVSTAALSGGIVSDANASWRYMETDTKQTLNDLQKLYRIVFNRAVKLQYARYKDSFMKRIITKDHKVTNAWERVSTIQDFVYGLTANPDGEIQFLATRTVSIMESVAKELLHTQEPQLPWLEPNRRVFAFANGCYMAKEEMFIKFSEGSPPTMPDGKPCPTACKYHDNVIEEEWITTPDWMNIPTPLMSKIMDTQELSPDVKRVYFSMLGRSIYDLGELDNWQVFLFVKGAAETGKSTLLKFISSFYNMEDIGVLSNNIEDKFGPSMIADKFMVVGDDLGENFTLDQQLFQNMSSGNEVSLPVKNGQAIKLKWITQLLLSGNVLPDYKDNSGSFSRRLIIVHYSKLVRHVDPTIPERLKNEIGAAIIKCNRAYNNMVRRLHSLLNHPTHPVTFWDAVPEEFRIQKRNVMQCANPFMNFLNSGALVFGPSLYMTKSMFTMQLMNHCQANNIPRPKFQASQYEGPFGMMGLVISSGKQKRMYPKINPRLTMDAARGAPQADFDHPPIAMLQPIAPKEMNEIWVLGCDLATSQALANASDDVVRSAEFAVRNFVQDQSEANRSVADALGCGRKRPNQQQQQQYSHRNPGNDGGAPPRQIPRLR
jgi:hypothetical protein